MVLKASLVIVLIRVLSSTNKVSPTYTRAATINAMRYRWMSSSSSTSLVSGTLPASLWVTLNKRVLPGPFGMRWHQKEQLLRVYSYLLA